LSLTSVVKTAGSFTRMVSIPPVHLALAYGACQVLLKGKLSEEGRLGPAQVFGQQLAHLGGVILRRLLAHDD